MCPAGSATTLTMTFDAFQAVQSIRKTILAHVPAILRRTRHQPVAIHLQHVVGSGNPQVAVAVFRQPQNLVLQQARGADSRSGCGRNREKPGLLRCRSKARPWNPPEDN